MSNFIKECINEIYNASGEFNKKEFLEKYCVVITHIKNIEKACEWLKINCNSEWAVWPYVVLKVDGNYCFMSTHGHSKHNCFVIKNNSERLAFKMMGF